jgi:hypothetical protein
MGADLPERLMLVAIASFVVATAFSVMAVVHWSEGSPGGALPASLSFAVAGGICSRLAWTRTGARSKARAAAITGTAANLVILVAWMIALLKVLFSPH